MIREVIREALADPRQTVAAFLALMLVFAAGISLYIVLWGGMQ